MRETEREREREREREKQKQRDSYREGELLQTRMQSTEIDRSRIYSR